MARVQVRGIIVGTGGQVFISLGTPNVRGGQRDRGVLRGSEEGTRVPVVCSCIVTRRNYEVSMV
jgi:hypothetical protein